VAIPIRNEAAVIGQCLIALAAQDYGGAFTVVAYLNNCSDSTAEIIRQLEPRLPYAVRLFDEQLPPGQAHAGMARRIAMQRAAADASANAVLLTTDADSRVPSDWISANLAAIKAGADAVAGMAEIDAADAALLPRRLIADEEKCDEYTTLLDEIDCLLDPQDCDPWPRHTQHSGASIAVRAAVFARSGGIPPVPVGEDRQFFAALRRIDARIRHAPDIVVTISGRTVGRAKGGMADTIARRLVQPDSWLDDNLEPAQSRLRRAMLRSCVREAWLVKAGSAELREIATTLGLPFATIHQALNHASFGQAWSMLEQSSPKLQYHRVAAQHLRYELRIAREILQGLRKSGAVILPVYQYDIASFSAALIDAEPAAADR
jgi:hypothetical protein